MIIVNTERNIENFNIGNSNVNNENITKKIIIRNINIVKYTKHGRLI